VETLYINGVQVEQKATTLAMQRNTLPLYIGTSPWDSFAGEISDVQVWNSARSQGQILESMSSGIRPDAPDLIANWTFRTVSRGRSYDMTHHTKAAQVLGQPVKTKVGGRERILAWSTPGAVLAPLLASIPQDCG
jgi:hypothetical protein